MTTKLCNTDVEIDFLADRVLMDINRDYSSPDNNLTKSFIKYLYLAGIEEAEIVAFFDESGQEVYSFFKENEEEHTGIFQPQYRIFRNYPSIFFWKFNLCNDFERKIHGKMDTGGTDVLVEYVRRIAEYILEKEMDSLVTDISYYIKFIKDNAAKLDRYDLFRHCHSNIILPLWPRDFLTYDLENKYYPVELFEKIREIIPSDHQDDFVYESGRYKTKKISSISCDEQEEPHENNDIKSDGWTKKDYYDKWEFLINSSEENLYLKYAELITKWGKHFPVKLLIKELEKKNMECIDGVLQSENECAVRVLWAYISMGFDVKIRACHVKLFFVSGETNINYYKLLIMLHCDFELRVNEVLIFGESEIDLDGLWEVLRHSWLASWSVNWLSDISYLINSDIAYGKKVKKSLEEKGIIKQSQSFQQILDTNANAWLYEHKELKLEDFKSACNRGGHRMLEKKVLEKPFSPPPYTEENAYIMAHCFYRDLSFHDFRFEEQNIARSAKLWAHSWPTIIQKTWKRYWQSFIEKTYGSLESPKFEKPLLPIIPEYADYILSRMNDVFSTAIIFLIYEEYRVFLTESRKLQIKKLLKKKVLLPEEAENLTKLADNPNCNYYAWSDEEIKKCLLPDKDSQKAQRLMQLLHAGLEPEFMVRIFERSICWVIEHKDSELWLSAPWFGMQIFNRSYIDRPSIWAKNLIKILEEWQGSENMLIKICFALGHLRESLGGRVPTTLRSIAKKQTDEKIKGLIIKQANLFNGENFNKGHHRNPVMRVKDCKDELIRGQNLSSSVCS